MPEVLVAQQAEKAVLVQVLDEDEAIPEGRNRGNIVFRNAELVFRRAVKGEEPIPVEAL